jgi:hypothetical protein
MPLALHATHDPSIALIAGARRAAAPQRRDGASQPVVLQMEHVESPSLTRETEIWPEIWFPERSTTCGGGWRGSRESRRDLRLRRPERSGWPASPLSFFLHVGRRPTTNSFETSPPSCSANPWEWPPPCSCTSNRSPTRGQG